LPEIEKIESMSIDWIRKNVKVYSKELDLQTAHKIPGLRAVFGESYPDPVRVVTLEYDIDEIAKDILNPKWRNTSVEFCGGTFVRSLVHVAISNFDQAMSQRPAISKTLSL
jgi:alanyl-tRNA synthetase